MGFSPEIWIMSCDDKINKFSYVETYSPTNYEYDYYSVSASTITGVDGTYQVDFIGSEKTSPNFLKDFEIKGGTCMDGT